MTPQTALYTLFAIFAVYGVYTAVHEIACMLGGLISRRKRKADESQGSHACCFGCTGCEEITESAGEEKRTSADTSSEKVNTDAPANTKTAESE